MLGNAEGLVIPTPLRGETHEYKRVQAPDPCVIGPKAMPLVWKARPTVQQ